METSIVIYLYDIYASLRCFMAEFQLPSIVSPVRPRTNHCFFSSPTPQEYSSSWGFSARQRSALVRGWRLAAPSASLEQQRPSDPAAARRESPRCTSAN